VNELRRATQAVGRGDLKVRIAQQRADDFGPLIDEFNAMVGGLREKTRIEETFGRHVGRQIARQILERDESLGGVEQEITVMFVDIRNFTARAAASTPTQVVSVLNLFLTAMVEIVEQGHGGIVNKFLGDGLMALFSELTGRADHADAAVDAGHNMLARLDRINVDVAALGQPPLAIGIEIHTGPAVVGSIGSPRRLEYTAIGDTVNVASRVESLTKTVGKPLLLTAATRAALRSRRAVEGAAAAVGQGPVRARRRAGPRGLVEGGRPGLTAHDPGFLAVAVDGLGDLPDGGLDEAPAADLVRLRLSPRSTMPSLFGW
jgi:adenylate cyclase